MQPLGEHPARPFPFGIFDCRHGVGDVDEESRQVGEQVAIAAVTGLMVTRAHPLPQVIQRERHPSGTARQIPAQQHLA